MFVSGVFRMLFKSLYRIFHQLITESMQNARTCTTKAHNFYSSVPIPPGLYITMLFLTKMNRLFTASLLIALVAIQLTAPIGVASESVLASDPTRGQDTFAFESEGLGLERHLKSFEDLKRFKSGKKSKKGGKKSEKGGKKSKKGGNAPTPVVPTPAPVE